MNEVNAVITEFLEKKKIYSAIITEYLFFYLHQALVDLETHSSLLNR